MNQEFIKQLIDIVSKSNLSEFEYDGENMKIKMAKATSPLAEVAQTIVHPQGVLSSVDEPVVNPHYKRVEAPIVGTFYRASSPKAAAFVEVGQSVKQGDTIAIIEAMKVLNEIKAPMAGVIQSVLVEDATMVEFGQPLFEIGE
ncbi:MAG: acetyl-CoA carboxylase biotin carboxyl carrier protein [Erysipelotrichaceae bacterium]